MEEMGKLDPKAVEWLSNKPAKHWSRSYFRTFPQCDILLNNICESYNKMILDARSLPILSMSISLIEITMKRLQKNRDTCNEKWKSLIYPKIMKILQKNIDDTRGFIAMKSDDYHYMVEVTPNEKYSADMRFKTCGCRASDLSGIPCKHDVAAIDEQGFGSVEYVNNCYHVTTYKKAYKEFVMPINGKSEWTKSGFIPPEPPNAGRTVGRPETERRKEADEPRHNRKRKPQGKQPQISKANPNKLKKQQDSCICGHCGVQGHNIRTCPLKKQDLLRNMEDIYIPTPNTNNEANLSSSTRKLQAGGQKKISGYSQNTSKNSPFIPPTLVPRGSQDTLNTFSKMWFNHCWPIVVVRLSYISLHSRNVSLMGGSYSVLGIFFSSRCSWWDIDLSYLF